MRRDRLRIVVGCPAGGSLGEVRALRDAGHEVIHAGASDPAQLAATVVQEDADLVLVMSDEPGSEEFVNALREELDAADSADVEIVTGGTGEVVTAFLARRSAP